MSVIDKFWNSFEREDKFSFHPMYLFKATAVLITMPVWFLLMLTMNQKGDSGFYSICIASWLGFIFAGFIHLSFYCSIIYFFIRMV